MRSFGKQILRIILAGAVFFVLDRFADVQTEIEAIRFSYAYPYLSCVSVVFGPIVAGCAGILGLLFSALLGFTAFQWIDLVCIFLFCLLCAFSFARRIDIKDGILGRNDLNVFFKTQLLVNGFVWFIVRPLLYHFVLNYELVKALDEGALLAFDRAVSGMLIGTMLLGIFVSARYTEACFYRT